MATTLTVNGTGYSFPDTGDENWGDNVSAWAAAVTGGMLQKAGGTFTLTAEVDFGATFGLKTAYIKSRATNPGSNGILRLGNAESISWRNAANSADLALKANASDLLEFNGTALQTVISVTDTSTIDLTLTGAAISAAVIAGSLTDSHIASGAAIAYSKLALTGSIVNADISASAAIAYSKLALTGSIVNADISASAAIAYSKLSLAASIVNADIATGAAIAYSKLNLAGSIVNADVSASAAIAYSKLALTGAIVNADISSSAAIAYSKLSLAASIVNADIASSAAIAYSKLNLAGSIATTDLASGFTLAIAKGGTGQTTASAAFDALSPNTTKGDITVRGASSNTRLGVGTDGQVLIADSTQSVGVKWGVPTLTAALNVVSKTGAYTLTASDDVVLASGSAFTLTLPTAVGATGKVYRIKKTDSSLSNIITIATTSSQNIDGGTSTTLNTQYEEVTLVSDGSGWQVINRRFPSAWTSFTMSITGSTSNPTKASSPLNDAAFWKRVGDSVMIRYDYEQTSATGAAVGSGAYLFNAPSGITFDTAKLAGAGAASQAVVGSAAAYDGVKYLGVCYLNSSSNIYLDVSNDTSAATNVGSSRCPLSGANCRISFIATVPVSGWNG